MNRPLTEAEIGAAWATLARGEGHMGRVPLNPKPPGRGLTKEQRKTAERTEVVRALAAEGKTMPEIARETGIPRPTVWGICDREKIDVKHGVGGNPNPVPRTKK